MVSHRLLTSGNTKKSLSLFVLGLLVFAFFAQFFNPSIIPTVKADDTIDSYLTAGGGDEATQLTAVHPSSDSGKSAVSQCFTGLDGYEVTSAQWSLLKVNSPVAVLVASIYDITGTYGTDGKPTGSALATSDGVAASGLTGSYQMVTFTFSTPLEISAQYYVLTVEVQSATTIDGSNLVSVERFQTSPAHDGNFALYSSSAWTAYDSIDNIFAVYGTETGGEAGSVPVAGYDYTLYENSTAFSVMDAGGDVVFNTTDANTAHEYAYELEATVYVANGTYDSPFSLESVTGANVTYSSSSLCTIGSEDNLPVLGFDGCSNISIYNVQVDGDAAEQTSEFLPDGIYFYNCDNCTIYDSSITNVYRDGFATAGVGVNNGVQNTTITFCGWNGITLGGGAAGIINNFAINCTIAYCSDVAISSYGYASIINYNDIFTMNGTTNTQAHWGIGVEAYGYCQIIGNTIEDVGNAIEFDGNSYPSLVKGNTLTNVANGFISMHSAGNIFTENSVTEWTGIYGGAFVYDQDNDIVSFNTFIDTSGSVPAVYLSGGENTTVANNTITIAGGNGIITDGTYDYSLIYGNDVDATTGININGATCDVNKLLDNDVANCSTGVDDTGTGTIINPTSSATYKLHWINPVNGTGTGVFVYSNSTTTYITLEEGQVSNVNGENATAYSGTTYEFVMNQDYFTYVMEGEAPEGTYHTLTISEPSGSGAVSPDVGEHEILEGTNQTLVATPGEGYSFVDWEIDGANETATATWYVVMDGDRTAKAYFIEDTYELTLTVTDPENTTYTETTIPVELSTGGNATGVTVTWNFQFPNGTWLHGSNQTYSEITSFELPATNMTNGLFCALAEGDNSTIDYKEVYLSLEMFYTLSLTITNPQNTTYAAIIPVELSSSGNDTNPVYSWNVQFSNATWLYETNQTGATASITIPENQTNVLFACYVEGDNAANDYGEVTFSVEYIISTPYTPTELDPTVLYISLLVTALAFTLLTAARQTEVPALLSSVSWFGLSFATLTFSNNQSMFLQGTSMFWVLLGIVLLVVFFGLLYRRLAENAEEKQRRMEMEVM